jgi:hypothetical protein
MSLKLKEASHMHVRQILTIAAAVMTLGFQIVYAQPIGQPICNNPWGPPWCTDGSESQAMEAQRRAIVEQEARRRAMEAQRRATQSMREQEAHRRAVEEAMMLRQMEMQRHMEMRSIK